MGNAGGLFYVSNGAHMARTGQAVVRGLQDDWVSVDGVDRPWPWECARIGTTVREGQTYEGRTGGGEWANHRLHG